jgi:Uma2 family endonuclease
MQRRTLPVGAPDVIVEVLSPSNTYGNANRRRVVCLQNGCVEYWVIDLDLKTVEVATDHRTRNIYHVGETIPMTAFPGRVVEVAAIFPQ